MSTEPERRSDSRWRTPDWMVWLFALIGPPTLTAVLVQAVGTEKRNYVFLYLALIAIVGVLRGLWPALVAAAGSFFFVDYFFVAPYYTFSIARPEDMLNLAIFVVTAAVVGLLASRRRRALLESETLTGQLRDVNSELVRLNKEQAEAAQGALRLARSEQQIRALQESDRLRRELLANVSHELRTPLGTILHESTDPGGITTTADAQRKLETVAAEARRLETLVTDMLDLARIEGGALDLDLEPVRLADAITAAVDRLHRASPQRGVEWEHTSADVEVLADWGRLGQVFDNLLANANRYAPAGTPISVDVSGESPGLATVRVGDQGHGVSPALRLHLFERFARGDSEEDPGGTGLGLAIVKGLVEAHAGSVVLEDSPERSGAVFRFTVPLAPPNNS